MSLVVDESSVAVDSYAQAFRRQMEHCIVQTGDSGPRARRFELYPECYPEPVVEAHVLVKHVDRSDPQTNVIYEENWSGDRGSRGNRPISRKRVTTTESALVWLLREEGGRIDCRRVALPVQASLPGDTLAEVSLRDEFAE